MSDSSLRKAVDSFVPEMVKRALFLGAGMLFMTEEGVRKIVGEINLPREAVSYLIKQSDKSKKEFFSIFQRELNRFLSRVDVTRLSKEVLDGISVEVNAKVTLRTKPENSSLSFSMDQMSTSRPKKKSGARKE
jgi:isopentenyl diphosphate isomerase/L-lactate dehydrogenase-like FMN-dependent dehydrogenase